MKSFENLPPIDQRESFEEKAPKVYEAMRESVLSHLCSPNDGEECINKWTGVFDTVFKRAIDADPAIIDKLEENMSGYRETIISEMRGEVEGPDKLAA